MLSSKIDGAYLEDGYLYLTSGNEVIEGPLGPFSGGGGGGGTGNNAVLTVSNTSGWLSKSIASGAVCEISVTWSSLEDDLPTGNGTLKPVSYTHLASQKLTEYGSYHKWREY